MRSTLPLLVMLACASGCTSMRSTMFHHDAVSEAWYPDRPEVAGVPVADRGVPITVKVTTHLRVSVVEHHYMQMNGTGVKWIDLDVPVRSITMAPVETEKIITVDTVRPGAGTMDATLAFSGQYMDKIDYRSEDQTIRQITTIVKNFAPKGLFGAATAEGGLAKDTVPAQLKEVTSTVAHTLIALDDPGYEQQLYSFLNRHLTGCHTCRVVAPGMKTPERRPRLTEAHRCNNLQEESLMPYTSEQWCPGEQAAR